MSTLARAEGPRRSIAELASKNAIVLVLLGLVLVIGAARPSFLNPENLVNILRISSVRAIIALGVGGILIMRGTDLSAGRTVGFAAVVAASLAQRDDYASKLFKDLPMLPLLVPVLAALGVGLLVGLLNGSVVAFLKVPPFIATLGMMVIVYGAVSLYVDRPPMGAQPLGGLREDFTNIGTGDTLTIPNLILIAALVTLVTYVILNRTRLGKNVYAIGGNPEAAVVSGVSVWRNTLLVYAFGGLLYGLAGALLAARTGGATNNYGQMYELDAIAACVIGGVSTSGGIGTVGGMITGVLIFEVLNNGLVVLGVSAYWQQIVKGIIIVAAVAIDIQKYVRKR
ncbi:MAG: galactose/methyl galactoside ABC transporter permease MglC [Spirochaetales bacterium]|nr:galactose/methyl galactoside ABC transporter permease MglC [Spirochaetales bacterium]